MHKVYSIMLYGYIIASFCYNCEISAGILYVNQRVNSVLFKIDEY